MSLEKIFEKEKNPDIDWGNFWNNINKKYSIEYDIHHDNISSSKNATKGFG